MNGVASRLRRGLVAANAQVFFILLVNGRYKAGPVPCPLTTEPVFRMR
jgi:hypothetical protein